MPKVSIVVPVCNVEKYVAKCLDSIMLQTLTDIEIICVDDGSTDKSGMILDQYAKKDARIRVIHKPNSGYGDSMNIGIDIATGEFVGIVESDDVIKPQMYEVLYSKAKENDLDLIKSNAIFWWETIGLQESSYKKELDDFYNVILKSEDREIMFRFFMNTWTGIYKKEFLKKYNIRHNTTPGASYQDNGFWMQTLCFCEKAMWLKDAFYYYRQDNPFASIKSKNKMYAMLNEYQYISDVLKNRVGIMEESICNYFRMFRHRGTFYRIDDNLKREFCNTMIEDYKCYKDFILMNENLNNWFEQICLYPDETCKKTIDKKRLLEKSFEHANKIVLYGAGQRAKATIKRLYNIGVFEKISAIVVTKMSHEKEIATIPIFSFYEFGDYDDKTLFIIAISEKTDAYRNVLAALEKKEIYNYIASTELVQLFYSVS